MKYTNLSEDDMDVVQKFAFGGIANPVQRPYLRSTDREFLAARQAELDAFEEQRLAYNTALSKYQEEVFKPYQAQAQAYNTAAQQYNTDVYEPYQQQYSAYEKAVEDFNAGDRTADYAGPAEPTLARAFEMQAPTAPGEFSMAAPALPFKEEEVVARQQAAAQTARRDAGNRATAINVVSNPEQFGFGSMSIANRFMAEGGPADKDTGPSARDMLDGMSGSDDGMVPGFAKGGEVDADDTPINTDPLGSAQQYMAQLTKAARPSPTRQSVKRLAKNTGGAAAPKEMGMGLDPLASAKDLVPQLADKGSSRQQMEDFVRAYQLKMDAAKNKARGLSADTFGAPTLERASLTKNTLAKKRFAGGGEVDVLEGMQKKARENEMYRAAEKYLQSREQIPDIELKRMGLKESAVFSSLNLPIGSGTITLNKDDIDRDSSRTLGEALLAHEITHAADRQMKQQAIEQRGKGTKFAEAYEKLMGPEGRNRLEPARRADYEWTEGNRLYRSTPNEIAAYGVGAFSAPVPKYMTPLRAPLHVDATAATEFQILLDLAQRDIDKGPKGLAKIPAFARKFFKYADGGPVKRAKGSPEEGEESLDTYYAPKARPSMRKVTKISSANEPIRYIDITPGMRDAVPYAKGGLVDKNTAFIKAHS